jgi:hypothetical protein
MKKIAVGLLVSLVVWLSPVSSAFAAWVSLGRNQGVSVTVLESSPTRIALEYKVGGFERHDLAIDGRIYSKISLPGEAERLERGLPELPVVARSVIIPDDRRMELRVTAVEYTDFRGITPAPSKGNLLRTVDPAQVPFSFDPFYSSSAWYPEQDAVQREPYVFRDYRGTTVVVTPIRFQPSTNTLRVATRMVVELVDVGPGGANILVRDRAFSAVNDAFDQVYRGHFLNSGMQPDKYATVPETGSMLVICYDSFAPDLQPFVDWKNQSGLPTAMVLMSEVGTTSTEVRNFIADRYNASGNPKLAFVLLVGDSEQIPTPSSDGGSADPIYGKITGDDWYPEVFIGRFSAENAAQVQTQVLRTVNYEKMPLLAGGDWWAKGVGIASNQGPGDDDEIDYEHIGNIRTKLLNFGYTFVDSIYDPGANATMVASALNQGRGIINYSGHGSQNAWSSSGFNSAGVNALTNDQMLPFIFSVACVNGKFASGSCFAEAWLRATHNGNPTGAVAAYMSSINQLWNPPMAAQDEANDLLVADQVRTFGSLCCNGACLMIDQYGADGAAMFNTWLIFGDPSLQVRTKTPTPIIATHPDSIAVGTTIVSVETDCPGAICGLAVGSTAIGAAVADANGVAEVAVADTLPGGQDLTLTVTGHNRIPYIGSVAVRSVSQPLLVLDPTSFEVAAGLDSTIVDTLHITNMGGAADTLTFTLSFVPQTGDSFVNIYEASGRVPYGETFAAAIGFNNPGLRSGAYEGLIRVLYNSDRVVDVPAVLRVGASSGVPRDREAPTTWQLEAARPNPFAGSATLRYGQPAGRAADLVVFDTAGRTVRCLAGGTAAAGPRTVEWDGRDDAGRVVPTGVYFVRLRGPGCSLTQRLLRIR